MSGQFGKYSVLGGSGGGVTDLNGLSGSVVLVAGTGITLTPAGNNITIDALGGGLVFPIIAPSGSAVAPSYAFSETGNDTGLFSQSDGDISFSNNATLGMSLDASHNLTVVGNITAANFPLTGTANTFAGFDGAGALESIPGFSIDTTSGGMDENLTEHPNNGGGNTVNNFNVFFEPLQNSPNENWNIQSIQAFMDNASSGFSQGTNGSAAQLLNLSFIHQGTGDTGGLNFLTMNSNIGNGTDPISVKGMGYAFGFGNIHANVTLDGSLQGYGFQPNVDAAAIGTSNFGVTAFYDFPNINIPVHGYNSFNAGPNIFEITNNNNYNGVTISPTIPTLTGNANLNGYGFYPTVTTVGATGQIIGLNMNPTITTLGTNANFQGVIVGGNLTTMGTSSNYNGVAISGNITTSHGNINGLLVNPTISGGDAGFYGLYISPQGGATLTNPVGVSINMNQINSTDPQGVVGISSDSRLQINSNTQLMAAQGFQIGSRIEHLFTVPAGSPVTGTDSLAVNIAGDLLAQDDIALGGFGLGFVSSSAIADMAVASGKTVASVTAFLPTITFPDPGFPTGGAITNAHMVRTTAPLAEGGTAVITNLYGFQIDSTFGDFSAAATNAYGIYLDAGATQNWISGKTLLGGTTFTAPTADLHLPGVTAAAGTASLKIDSGTLMTTPENGAVESDGTDLFWTDNTGARQTLNNNSFPIPADVARWTKYTVTFADLAIASTTNDAAFTPPLSIGAKQFISAAVIKTSTSFTGGGATSYNVSVGSPATGFTSVIPGYDAFAPVSDTNFITVALVAFNMYDFGASTAIRINAASDVNLDQITQGSLDVWVQVSTLP